MDDQVNLQCANVFATAFGEAFRESLTRRVAGAWTLKVIDDPNSVQRPEDAFRFCVTVSGALNGECTVSIRQEHAAALGAKLLPPDADVVDDEDSKAMAEAITQAMEDLGALLTTRFGVTACRVEAIGHASADEQPMAALSVSDGGQLEASMLFSFNEALLAGLGSGSGFGSGSSPDSPESGHPSDGASEQAGEPAQEQTRKTLVDASNLQLVMDVELNVSLRFGQCRLPLREVLDLGSGSVIELDRDVDDPVELLLEDKVIARGEAVIVDGNYGLRITEIPEPLACHFIRQNGLA